MSMSRRLHTTTTSTTSTTYQDNASMILPISVDPDDLDSIKRVAVTLCPLLEIPMLKKSLSDSSSSSSGGATERSLESNNVFDDDEEVSVQQGHDDLYDTATTSASTRTARSTQIMCNVTTLTPTTSKVTSANHIHGDDDYDDDDDDIIMDHLVVRPLSGGLSNKLFVVSNPSTERSVLVRIHPDDHHEDDDDDGSNSKDDDTHFCIVNRQLENQLVSWLSSHQAAPTFYGRFENGRVEEFYLRAEPLRFSEMQCYEGQIAALMARLHALTPPADILPPPPSLQSRRKQQQEQNATTCNGEIWSRMQEWLTYAKKMTTPSTPHDHAQFLLQLESEYHWLYDQFTTQRLQERSQSTSSEQQFAIDFCSQIVLTHMDCQSLNLLKCNDYPSRENTNRQQQQQQTIKLIDFEYAGWNPRGIDIANTFCEHANMNELQADFRHDYPTVSTQATFLQAYLATTTTMAQHNKSKNSKSSSNSTTTTINTTNTPPWTDTLCHALCYELGRYAAISHLEWAIWSLVQISLSEIEFDYMAYAQHRMEGYYLFKQEYFL